MKPSPETYSWRNLGRAFLCVDGQPLSSAERLRSSVGGFLFIGIAGFCLFLVPVGDRGLLASVGASAVILYALPHSPAAAPWSLVGGYMASAASALISLALIPSPLLAAAFAVGGAIWLMARFKCVHPPGGSLALLVVLAAPHHWVDLEKLIAAIAANTFLAAGLALLINRGVLRRSYPQLAPRLATAPSPTPVPQEHTILLHEDLDHAFRQRDTFVDVDESELVTLFDLAVNHAYQRQQHLTCRDIMTRSPLTVTGDTSLSHAWSLLQIHRCEALPVTDAEGRLQGLITLHDFLNTLPDIHLQSVRTMVRQWLPFGAPQGQPQWVKEVMAQNMYRAHPETPFPQLVTDLMNQPAPHVPVVDAGGYVIGIISRSDILQALYRQLALGLPPTPVAPQEDRVNPA